MAWDPITSPCDYIILGGKKSPGIATVMAAGSERDYAVRQPPFSTGAIIIFKRRNLADFTVLIKLYTPEDFAAFREWRQVVDALPSARTKAKALDIWHPLLEDLDIKQCVVKRVGQLDQIDDGEWQITISFLESRDVPQQTLAKVDGAQATPGDPLDQQLDENTGKLDKMAEELFQ